MKKLLILLGLSLAVAMGFCGCGNEKSEETGIEIKKISEEEVYELLARVEEKANKIEFANLSMDQGFQEKWDLLKRKQSAADRAFSKNDYNATSKFLQEAESAADWIMSRGPLRYEADEKYSELQSRKRYSNSNEINAPKYASTIYAEAEKYEQQGREAYEMIEFEEATRLYVLAADKYKKATSTASAFHAAVYEMNAAKEKADKEKASQFASTIYQPALSSFQQAIKANAQGRYDEALQLLESAENKLKNAATTASQFHSATQDVLSAKNAADEDIYNAKKYAASYYLNATVNAKQGIDANAQGRYEEALQHLSAAESSFRKARSEAPRGCIRDMVNSLVKVEAGTFNMGSDNGYNSEKPVHQVTLSKDFYIGKYEVTQRLWQIVMNNNPSKYKGLDRPVEEVSWNEAMAFCKKLNELGWAPKGYKFTLPTEAQWEFAARGGNKSKGYTYSGSNDVKDVAWYNDNTDTKHHNVGTKQPNELGIYDMSGNVCEWCLDWYGGYGEGAVTDPQGPQGPQNGSHRVIRGGSWSVNADYCRSAFRDYNSPDYRLYSCGFRVALVPVQ